MNQIVQKRINFNKLLRELYKTTNGQTNYRVDLRALGAQLKIREDNFTEAYNDLKAHYFIEPFGSGYNSRLTDDGIKYIDSLEFLDDKEIVLCTIKYLKTMSGYRKIYEIFDAVGVRDDDTHRKYLLDLMYKQKLIEPSNYSEEVAALSQTGRTLTEVTYDNLNSMKISHIMDYNSKRQIMLEAYKNGNVQLEIELQPILKDYLNDEDIREFIQEFYDLGYITKESKQLSNGGHLMGHHLTNKGQHFLQTGGFLKQADKEKVAPVINNSIINHGPNYGIQSAGHMEGNQRSKTVSTLKDKEEKNKSLAIRFWKLISENQLISALLVGLITFLAGIVYKHYFPGK